MIFDLRKHDTNVDFQLLVGFDASSTNATEHQTSISQPDNLFGWKSAMFPCLYNFLYAVLS